MRTAHPSVVGVVEVWHNEDGWGVLRTPDGLSVWCHFSQVEVDGYKELTAGEQLRFDYETPGQDGCDGRVSTSAQPVDARGAGAVQDPLSPSERQPSLPAGRRTCHYRLRTLAAGSDDIASRP